MRSKDQIMTLEYIISMIREIPGCFIQKSTIQGTEQIAIMRNEIMQRSQTNPFLIDRMNLKSDIRKVEMDFSKAFEKYKEEHSSK